MLVPHCTGSGKPTGVVHPTVHALSDDSSESDVVIQDDPVSADDDILLLVEASQELFEATRAEPLVVTLGDDKEPSRVVELSDDEMEERVGAQG